MKGEEKPKIKVWLLAPGDRENWQGQWLPPGSTRRRTKTLGTSDPEEAEKRRAELEARLNAGLSEDTNLKWADFVERLLADPYTELPPDSVKSRLRTLERFNRVCRPRTLADISGVSLSDWRASLKRAGLRPATIAKHVAHLKTALKWACRQGFMEKVPHFEPVRIPAPDTPRTIDRAAFDRLLAAVPSVIEGDATATQWRLYLETLWRTGMRKCEASGLHWSRESKFAWIDLEKKRIRFPPGGCKAGVPQWIPLHPSLAELLTAVRKESGPVFALGRPQRIHIDFSKIRAKAGVDCRIHDLRRSFGSRYAPLVPAQVLQKLMRHASIATTLKYYVDLDPALEDAINLA